MRTKISLASILININNIYEAEYSPACFNLNATPNDKVLTVIRYLNQCINENDGGKNITLDSLEKQFFVNRYYLCHQFKKKCGMTIWEYINNKKISKSCDLLRNHHSAMEVSNMCGFNNYTHFYRIFKQITNMSPKDYLSQIEKDKKQYM